ncbi:heparinase II/III family protein [Paenibacillus sp. LHD-117]|uniref:heparinase II/III domain-containing protein n=1 Tax=Paenibacillus sp. LHD-117 TaxID=3071412 RepID=UPI0027E070FC|nr:heparinase II/III family protein [Paenibacillus sp. LHD-117]MDQ6422788.1 heparinase II/III family protein [Paenibacillus sp. LHD-117]
MKRGNVGLGGLGEALHGRARGFELLGGAEDSRRMADRLLRDGSLSGLVGEIESEADRMLGEEEPLLTDELFRDYGETGERLPYERVYFEKRKRLNAFALMAWLRPSSPAYLDALHKTAWSVCEEFTWCLPAHYGEKRGPYGNIDLFAAETGFALCEMAALLGDALEPELAKRIAEEAERRLFEPYLEQGPYPWEKLENNWSSVCAGSIGSAALYAIADADRLARVLEKVQAAMDCFLAGYGEDGACVEGYSYWQYGFGYYVYYADLLKTATSGAFDGFSGSKAREIALFQQRCFSGGDTVINFSDSPQYNGVYMGLTMRLRDEYPEVALPNPSLREPYAADHCGRWAHALRNLIWASSSREGAVIAEAEAGDWPTEARYLADAGWFLSRYVPERGTSYCFAAKGGHNGESHNHNDCGHFILHADGEAYLADLGSGVYTKQYFGPDRYTFWCNGSQGHSLPIVNGQLQEAGEQRKARVTEANVGGEEDRFALELSGLYPASAGLVSLARSFRWRKAGKPSLILTDRISFGQVSPETDADSVNKVVERFVTMQEPKLGEEGWLTIEGKRLLRIGYDARLWKPVVTARSDRDHFDQERHWHTLDFHSVAGMRGAVVEAVFTFEFIT